MTNFKHIIASGGSVWGFYTFGVIKEAIQSGAILCDDVRSVYGTSVGTLTCVFMCCMKLGLHVQDIEDYIVKRPWSQMLSAVTTIQLEKRGFISRKFFDDFLEPLLKSVDLSLKTTLAELYEKTQIETHYYTTELNMFELVDLSYKTHPDWTLVDAVYVSCTLPMVFDPMVVDGKCYIDGGFLLNYPVQQCASDWPDDLDKMLGISLGNVQSESSGPKITEESNFLDVVSIFFGEMIQRKLFGAHNHSVIQNNIIMMSTPMTFEYMYEMAQNQEMRQQLINEGVEAFRRTDVSIFHRQISIVKVDASSERDYDKYHEPI